MLRLCRFFIGDFGFAREGVSLSILIAWLSFRNCTRLRLRCRCYIETIYKVP